MLNPVLLARMQRGAIHVTLAEVELVAANIAASSLEPVRPKAQLALGQKAKKAKATKKRDRAAPTAGPKKRSRPLLSCALGTPSADTGTVAAGSACPAESGSAAAGGNQILGPEGWAERYADALNGLGRHLWPQTAKHGQHSWTLRSQSGATIEVLLRSRAFFLKTAAPGCAIEAPHHLNWAKCGGIDAAWELACNKTGFGEPVMSEPR